MTESSRRQFLGAAAALAGLPIGGDVDKLGGRVKPERDTDSIPVAFDIPQNIVEIGSEEADVSIYPMRNAAEPFLWMDIHGDFGEFSLALYPDQAEHIAGGLERAAGVCQDG